MPVLAPGEPDLTILHFSDLHLVPTQRDKIAWLRDLASVEPDLVVDTGDNMAHLDALPPLLHALEPLLTFPGAFVMGSNDYYAPVFKSPARYLLPDSRLPHAPTVRNLPFDELAKAFVEAGWKDLDNRRDVVDVPLAPGGDPGAGSRRIDLVGVDDPHLDLDRMPAPRDDAARTGPRGTDGSDGSDGATASGVGAAAGTGADPADPAPLLRLGVAHAPYVRVLDALYDDGADLVLAGHTHGGQLCVPGFGALVTNCDLDRGRASGLHGWPGARPDTAAGAGSAWLHVCAGLGTSPYTPVRIACRPEAVLLRLVARTA